ncbi:PHB depolymerase family esterase [Sphingomonas sp. JC676]|uniref:extracellular catalytic domain type 1 short-chain-length polyhydroxyalkanoate depolymerase n=1 Tax=Sphingomonas sp. JC676 TaxID=2768065 RepID=UPI001657E871|nr:PHB depolymerase family esterase [Sphingomonas sp. JC676]MBC9032125.1 PHB depolymerase family esterase [Sphingomonas sp. JC676]
MRPLSSTIARLATLRAQPRPGNSAAAGRLRALRDFGSNPGALGAWFYVPEGVRENAPLVVVLHGCTQDAAGYDLASGWSQLADEQGFIVLFPEQRRANNTNLCFNWFEPADSRRGGGEPLSIVQMIGAIVDREGVDPSRIYVNGLSAGGAMASVMLATYPELFAGGAIIAGLPFGAAAGVPQALERMRGTPGPSEAALAAAIRGASPHVGPWPTISIWHGTADHVVALANADAILKQWQAIHGVLPDLERFETVDGHPHRTWHDAKGRVVIEDYRITGMGHGTPLDTKGAAPCGRIGPHMLEAGISSTRRLADFWALRDAAAPRKRQASRPRPQPIPAALDRRGPARAATPSPAAGGVGKVIEDALRAAGLMR